MKKVVKPLTGLDRPPESSAEDDGRREDDAHHLIAQRPMSSMRSEVASMAMTSRTGSRPNGRFNMRHGEHDSAAQCCTTISIVKVEAYDILRTFR